MHLPHPRGSLRSVSIHPSGISHQLLPTLGPSQHQASIFGAACRQRWSVSDRRRLSARMEHQGPKTQGRATAAAESPQSQVPLTFALQGAKAGSLQGAELRHALLHPGERGVL